MWTKIFLALFAVAVVLMLVLIYFSYSQLQSIGFAPKDIAESFLSYRVYNIRVFWISSLVLLILANVILWLSRQAWALWLTLLFFVGFMLIQSWWLDQQYLQYVKQNNLSAESIYTFGRIISALLCVVVAAGIYFNQFFVLRMRDRIHGGDKEIVATQTPEEIAAEDEKTPEDNL